MRAPYFARTNGNHMKQHRYKHGMGALCDGTRAWVGMVLRWGMALWALLGMVAIAQAQVNNAEFVSQSVPATMEIGKTYNVSVTMKNTGTTIWTSGNAYKLGSQNPQDNKTWGAGRAELGSSVSPGQQVTITFNIKAPAAPGTYNFQWRMLREYIEWFGATAPNVAVSVSAVTASALDPVPTTTVRKSAFEYDLAGSGLLTKEIVEPDTPTLRLETTYGYDAFGNKNAVTVSSPATGNAAIAARTSTTTYDARGQFPVTSANALGHAETRAFDPNFGAQTNLTGPNNLATRWEYDAFGRKTREVRADGTSTKWEYFYCSGVHGGTLNTCPQWARYAVKTTPLGADNITQNGRWTFAYYDALDRQIRQETNDIVGGSAVVATVDTEYDALGRVKRTSRPYYAGQAVYWTENAYDELGRVVAVTNPDNTQVTTRYNGLDVSVTNAANQTETSTRNAIGQVVKVTDAAGNSVQYRYDATGNLARTTDANGNVTALTYDTRGRKTRMVDPDMGTWNYEYNALGELVRQTDAKGQVVGMVYDKLGRMTERREPDLVSTWSYDTCTKGIGKLCRTTADNGYVSVSGYDSLGRISSTTTTIDTTYTSSVTYDAVTGAVASRTYPTGLTVKYAYQLGTLQEIRNNATNALYWRLDRQNASGQIVQQSFGNTVVTQSVFDDVTGRLMNIYAGAGNGVQSMTYRYDAIGNLRMRVDGNQGLSETFVYDSLNRVTSSTVNSAAAGVQTQTYEYDRVGNITARSGLGSYSYGWPNSLPHAVLETVLSDGGTRSYAYDANGNMTMSSYYDITKTLVRDKNRTYVYTSFNMPQALGASGISLAFAYGPEHQRIKQIAPSATTIYLHPDNTGGMFYEKDIKADGSIEHKHFISAGSDVVAMVKQVGTTTTTQYFHRDSLGSTMLVTKDGGAVDGDRMSYDPFGKRRFAHGGADTAGTLAGTVTDRGYTNHEHLDELGLIHMNARIYDPVIGRFLSADPIIEAPYNMQSYNRYAYVMNNPLIYTDPSGYFKWSKFRDKWLRPIAAIGAAYFTGQWYLANFGASATIGAGAAGGFSGGLVGSGGNLKAAAVGAISGGLFGWAGTVVPGPAGAASMERYAAHAFAGCVSGELGGGGCGRGALSAVAGKAMTNLTAGWKMDDVTRGVVTAVAGGTASVIGGGKFENGAVTAAFGYLFNELLHEGDRKAAMRRSGYSDRGIGWLPIGDTDVPFYASPTRASLNDLADAMGTGAEYANYGIAASLAIPGGQVALPFFTLISGVSTVVEQAVRFNMKGLAVDSLVDWTVTKLPSRLGVPQSATIPIAEGIKKSPEVGCLRTREGC